MTDKPFASTGPICRAYAFMLTAGNEAYIPLFKNLLTTSETTQDRAADLLTMSGVPVRRATVSMHRRRRCRYCEILWRAE